MAWLRRADCLPVLSVAFDHPQDCGRELGVDAARPAHAITPGTSVQVNALLAKQAGNLTYVYMQRGIVEDCDADNARVRIVATPPHCPYPHPLHGKVVEVSLAELKPAPIPNYGDA